MMQHGRTKAGIRVTMAPAEKRAARSIGAVAVVASLQGGWIIRFITPSHPVTGFYGEDEDSSLNVH